MHLTIPLSLLVVHFVADFLFQTDWMAVNKSKDNKALAAHVAAYSLCFCAWGFPLYCVTFVSHFVTDWLTSRATSKLWFFANTGVKYNVAGKRMDLWAPVGGNRHYFFVMIGLDQLIHAITLAATYHYFVK